MFIKNSSRFSSKHLSGACGLCAMVVLFAPSITRAGLALEMNVIRYDLNGYYFSPNLTTNSAPPNLPFGDYQLASPQSPTNGISPYQYHFDTNGFSQTGGFSWGYGDFASLMQGLTNGTWSIFVTNSVTTNVYRFEVTSSINSNDLPLVSFTFPTNGAVNITNRPTYTWSGPTNYGDLVLYYYNNSPYLPVTQTSQLSSVLYQGFNSVTAHYDSNSTTAIVASVPTDDASQTISSWVSTAHLQVYSSSQFTVGTVDPSGTSHTLVAHFAWDDTNANGSAAGVDSSGNAYNLNFSGSFGSQGGANSTLTTAAGPRAIQFHNGDHNSAGYVGWNPTPTNLLAALSGSFSVSCWIKTTQFDFGWDQAPAYYGAGIVSADNDGLANDVIPLALTGSKIGFNTGGTEEDVTLNSTASVNDGSYHHVVVTRNQATGQKIIYLDGTLDSFSSGTTNLLNDPQLLTIGALSDASNSDASSTTYGNGYDGLLDDLQIYSGVLSSNEVAQLFANPGLTANQIITVPLVARYNFEDTNSPGIDSSGNGNDANCGTGTGSTTNNDTFSTDAAVGSYARQYLGNNAICFYPNGAACFNNLSNAIYGNFSWSAWVKTTNSVNADFADAYSGAPILFEYADNVNQAIFSITGSKAAFAVGNPNGGSDTILHSTTSVNDGTYHFLAVTRNAANGLMKLYVDGNLEAADTSTNGARIASAVLYLAGGYSGFFNGLLDDVRVYGGELSAADVATLSGHPLPDFNAALNTSGLSWTTGGDLPWFIETTNTHDTVSAAQSGAITASQASWIETTVTGPGNLSFWWQVSSEDGFDYLEFDLDGSMQDQISGDSGWLQQTYSITSGSHTLRWNYSKDGSGSAGLDAGFLDQVSFIFIPPTTNPPVITVQPFNQTNYPGYNVALFAGATSNVAITWQWYKVGSASPIPSGTNTLYIPTNSGTAGVAGNYFAIAANIAGSATTTVATVTFQNSALPPDWSRAFTAQLYGNGTDASTNINLACLIDSTGTNIYTVGSLNGTNTFGSDTLVSANGVEETTFLKQTATGTPVWGRCMSNNGTGHSYPRGIAAAPGDGFYAVGLFGGTNWLGTNKLVDTAGASTYLARFDANGSILWVRTIVGTNANFPTHHTLVSDPAGNVTLSTLVSGYTTLGTTNVFISGQQGILAQYDSNGNVRWVQMPSAWPDYLTYSAGRIYGCMGGGLTNYIGGITNISDRRRALFSINATNGQGIWVQPFAAYKDQGNPNFLGDNNALVAVSGTNIFVVGSAYGTNVLFGSFSLDFPGVTGQYFARYDTDGNAQLATPFGSQFTWPWAALADASGNVYVGSDFDTYSIYGSKIIAATFYETVQSVGNIDNRIPGQTSLAKFDRNGNPLWARLASSPTSYANCRDIALAPDGVWSCGFFNPTAIFGAYTIYGTLTCVGSPFCTPVYHQSGYLAKITDQGITPSAVTLFNPQNNGVNFQFQFLSQSGFNHRVLYRTNLVAGNWQTNSSIPGDGTLKTISLPLSIFSPSKQGFIRVLTQ